jgi:hypothetical protein
VIDLRTGAQIARVRAHRLSMLSRIGFGWFIWPWMWPLHMLAVGSKNQRIERIPGASLSVTPGCGGEEPDKAIRRVGIAACTALYVATLTALLVAIFTVGVMQQAALLIAVVLFGPVVVEGIAMLINAMIRPGELMLGRRRRQFATDDQVVLILTCYVRDPGAPKGTGQRLMTGLQDKWQAHRVIVIGYPANRALQRLYRDMGATGDGTRGRRMKFDYSSPVPGDPTR